MRNKFVDMSDQNSTVSEQDEPKADNCHNGKTTTVQKSEYTVIGNNAVFIINKETKQNDLDNTDETKLEKNFRENLRLSIQSWICNASFVQDCPTYLLDLIIKVESSTENSQFWKRCLADCEPLDRFFQKLLDNKTLLETTLPVVKYYLESLIPEYSLNISRTAQSISYWLQSTRVHHKRRSLLTIRPMESIADFVEQIRKFLVDMETKTISQGSSSDLDAYITSEMALAVYRLFQKLEWSSKYYEITFMQIMLLPLSYRKSSRNFEVQVEYSKLQQFFENTERQMELYLQVSNSDEKLQALLVDRLITEIKSIDQSSVRNTVNECIFQECLKPIEHLFVASVSGLLSKFTMESPFDFETLQKQTKALFETGPYRQPNTFDQLSDVLRGSISTQSQNITISTESIDNKIIPSNIKSLLAFFELDDYFPGKICLQNLMANANYDNRPSDIPWKILKKLILMDYRARDSILDDFYSSDAISSAGAYDENRKQFEEFLDDFCTDEEDTEIATSDLALKLYNPLDVFTITFCCCDNQLKQVLTEKMFLCKLAVPFIYPCPTSEHLLSSFWSLRSIHIELENQTLSVMDDKIQRVVFIRMQRPTYSKSKLINTLLYDVSHDTFLHRECSKVVTSKFFSDGLVETFWSIPSRCDNSEVLMYLNLRGDACNKKKQLEALKLIANVFVVIIDVSKLLDSKEVLESLYKRKTSMILVLTNETGLSKDTPTKYHTFLRNRQLLSRTTFISVSKKGELKTEIALRDDVLNKLKLLLNNENADSLENCESVLKELNIIDEERDGDLSCVLGKEKANQVIPREISLFNMKPVLLKLQQKDLLGKLSTLQQKKYNQGEKLSSADREKIRQEINEIRSRQIQICKTLSPYMTSFISTLLEVFNQPNVVLYFCHWLKLKFDAYSGKQLPKLNREMQQGWEALKLARKRNLNECEEKELKQRLLNAERDLSNANFGLEHLFREVGQIYESIINSNEEIPEDLKKICENLPKAVAKLLFHGHPFEIMDGDTVSVPLIWMKAVFRHIKSYIQEKKVLTVAVIGGQSTGKSTLLNSMFGVSFPVKAGRCTRGLFMQLLSRRRSKCSFDYVLIIDTEGLKLAASVVDTHDLNNKLTTLAIGLADVTIVNVQGEKVDVQEVLQIAVHGFFRLRRVYPNLNLNKHCVFLQQHVEAPNAEINLVYERQKFEEDLDILTKQAADQEGVTNIFTFKQVIDFDSKEHFWYFPGFWYGTPPTAPVNREYSRKVEDVKFCILEEIPNKIRYFQSIEDISIQLEDLWTGILSDNFVYSFRNSKQIRAYNNLNRKLHEVKFFIEDSLYEEEQRLLLSESDSEDLDECCEKIREVAETTYIHGEQQLDDFIDKNEYRDFQLPWRDKVLEDLSLSKEEGVKSAISNIKVTREMHTLNIAHKHKLLLLQLYREANLLAEEFKTASLKDEDLNEKFEEMWIQWVNQYRPKNLSQLSSIESIVKGKLYDFFQSSKHVLDDELKRFPLTDSVATNVMIRDLMTDPIRQYDYTGLQSKHMMNTSQDEDLQITILRKVDLYLNGLKKKDSKFDPTYVSRLLKIVTDEIDKHKNKSLANDISVIISVLVCRYALPIFRELNDMFEKKHSVESFTDDTFKDKTQRFFINVMKTREEDSKAGSLFCELLNIVLTDDMAVKVQQCIERNLMKRFSYSKKELIAFMLNKLLSPDSKFKSFQKYNDDPYTFTYTIMGDYTDKYAFGTNDSNSATEYYKQADLYLNRTFTTLHRIIDRVTNSVTANGSEGYIGSWIDEFTQNCKILPIPESFFKLVKEREVTKLRSFQEIVCRELDHMKKTLLLNSEKITCANVVWKNGTLCNNIMKKLWGCEEKCPFCHEPCSQNDIDHISKGIKHSCEVHKPPCLRGINLKGAKYAFYICSQLIKTNQTFKCVDCNYECRKDGICTGKGVKSVLHKYNEYVRVFPSWDIEQNTSTENCMLPYWKWFTKTFSHQLKTVLGAELPKSLATWANYTRKDAKESIPRKEIINRVSSV